MDGSLHQYETASQNRCGSGSGTAAGSWVVAFSSVQAVNHRAGGGGADQLDYLVHGSLTATLPGTSDSSTVDGSVNLSLSF